MNIYVIISDWDNYEMNHEIIEGYVTSEKEAIDAVSEIENYYMQPHPLGFRQKYSVEIMSQNEILWKNALDAWEYEKTQLFQAFRIECLDNAANKEQFNQLYDEFLENIKKTRVEWFNKRDDIQQLLPEGKTWEEVLNQYDVYMYNLKHHFNYACYKEISQFDKTKIKIKN